MHLALRKNILSLFGLIFFDQVSITLTFPLLTLVFFDPQTRLFTPETSTAVRSFWFGCCVALPNIINMFFAPALSIFSDHIGRKKILMIEIFSGFIFTFTVGVGVYTGQLVLVFLGFAVKGAFCRTNPTALAIVGDSVPKTEKVLFMGYLQFAISLGAAVGPFVGGFFAMRYFFTELNFALPFFLAAGLACLNTLLTGKYLRETLAKTSANENPSLQTIKAIFLQKDILKISLLLLLIQLSWSTYYQFTPPILKQLHHFESQQIGNFIAMIAVWLAVTTGIIIRLLQRIMNSQQMIIAAILLMLLGYLLTLAACTTSFNMQPWLVWAGAMPIAAGDVIAYSCLTALYSNAVATHQQGKVMGIGYIVVASIWALTGFTGGVLMGINPLLPLIIAPVGILSSLLLMRSSFGKELPVTAPQTA